ncbi:MAG: hypothetical protein OXG23_01625 [Chloroflexi bacterium]|nr:hypothetical protein [Chloroflexota bacterium]
MRAIMVVFALALLPACASIQEMASGKQKPQIGFRFLELLAEDDFESGEQWRQYADGADLFLGVRVGRYHIDFRGRQYAWAQRDGDFDDIVIEAEAAQVSSYDHNAYGLACRLDPGNRGRGYFFLISGDGYASIRWSNGRSLEPIASAAPSRHIMRGAATNRLRAVCVEDYLALWVNGEFVADARDGRAARGAVGLVGLMNYEGKRLSVAFDDLKIWRAVADRPEI